MMTFAAILRFFTFIYTAFAVSGIIWFFAIGDGSVRQLQKFLPVLLISMTVALPGVLIWLSTLFILKSKEVSVSDLTHLVIALGIGVVLFSIVGGWVWFEHARTTSVLGRFILRGLIWPTLVMSVICVPLAFVFSRYSKTLGLEKLF